MSDNSAALPRVIARVDAGVVLAALLLLAQAINFPTQCLGHDIALNGQPTGGPHEGGASPVHRHPFGEDASDNFAFGYLEFDRTPDPRGETGHISKNAPIQDRPARAEKFMTSILIWFVPNFGLPVTGDLPRMDFVHPAAMARLRYRGSAGNQAIPLDGGRDI